MAEHGGVAVDPDAVALYIHLATIASNPAINTAILTTADAFA